MNLSELDQRKTFSLLLLGVSGTGKTTLCCQLPKPWIIDCDNNIHGPAKYLKRTGKDVSNVQFSTPVFKEDGAKVEREDWYSSCAQAFNDAINSDCETIVVDSLTTYCDFVLIEVCKSQGRELGNLFLDEEGAKLADEQMQQQDWGLFFNAMKNTIMTLRASGKNTVFTGHTQGRQDKLTSTLEKVIACPGKTADLIAGFFEEVWLLESEIQGIGGSAKEVRKIRTYPQSALNKPLGLKSPSGIKSGTELDASTILEKLFE